MVRPEGRTAKCVQSFDDSQDSAIHISYRNLLRSSSMQEPRHPLPKVIREIFATRPLLPQKSLAIPPAHLFMHSVTTVRLPSTPLSTVLNKIKRSKTEAFEKPSSQIKPFATQVAQDANESESPTTPSLRKTRPTYSLSHALSIATKSSPIRKTNSQPPSSLLVICRY